MKQRVKITKTTISELTVDLPGDIGLPDISNENQAVVLAMIEDWAVTHHKSYTPIGGNTQITFYGQA